MNTAKGIWLALVDQVKQLISLPRSILEFFKNRKLQVIRDGQEAERLDRIRNPSKYLGK